MSGYFLLLQDGLVCILALHSIKSCAHQLEACTMRSYGKSTGEQAVSCSSDTRHTQSSALTYTSLYQNANQRLQRAGHDRSTQCLLLPATMDHDSTLHQNQLTVSGPEQYL